MNIEKIIFVPCNNKVVILVSDLYGDAKEGQDSGVVGYFYNADMYNQTFLDENVNLKQVSLSKRQKIQDYFSLFSYSKYQGN